MASMKTCRPLLNPRPTAIRVSVFPGPSMQNPCKYSSAALNAKESKRISRRGQADEIRQASGLERLPTSSLLRNLFLGLFITTPSVFRPGFAVLKKIANSNSAISNPDTNPMLRTLVKPLIYDQFCAGRDRTEIYRTRSTIRRMGYSGVILGYGKEIQVTPSNSVKLLKGQTTNDDPEIDDWERGNLRTLDMVGDGDWLAIKCTGAGFNVTGALMRNEIPPERFNNAMKAVCEKAKAKNCRVLIDAEQQVVQTAIDRVTVDLMRRYNKSGGQTLVYNTLQAYLKASRENLKAQLALASKEGWALGIKLVRGAYINNDERALIHDTKKDTDDSYNNIVRDLLSGSNLGLAENEFPDIRLFLAGHNPESIAAAMTLIQTLTERNRLKVLPDFGQLQGMGDNLGCRILQQNEEFKRSFNPAGGHAVVPKVYKYLTWGSIQECMQYLIRRVVENSGSTDRMWDGLPAYFQELKRRALWR